MRYNPNRLRVMDEDDYLDAVGKLKTDVSTFTDNFIHAWNKAPDLDDFIESYPLYDQEIFYSEIRKEMARITRLLQMEAETIDIN